MSRHRDRCSINIGYLFSHVLYFWLYLEVKEGQYLYLSVLLSVSVPSVISCLEQAIFIHLAREVDDCVSMKLPVLLK